MTANIVEPALISVVVSVFDIEDYLPKCLETLSSQTYRNLDIILVDDGSADRSGRLCDEFAAADSRATVIHQQNSGLWAARNAGQQKARGMYVMFVDGDDYLHPDAINRLYQAICSGDGFDLAMACYRETSRSDEDALPLEKGDRVVLKRDEMMDRIITIDAGVVFTVVWNKLYKKEVIDGIQAHNYARAQDYDFNIRVCGRIRAAVWLQEKLFFYVDRPGSLSRSGPFSQIDAWINISRILFDNYCRLPEDSANYRELFLKRLYFSMKRTIILARGTQKYGAMKNECANMERKVRKPFLQTGSLSPAEKRSLIINIRYPGIVQWLEEKLGFQL